MVVAGAVAVVGVGREFRKGAKKEKQVSKEKVGQLRRALPSAKGLWLWLWPALLSDDGIEVSLPFRRHRPSSSSNSTLRRWSV